MVQRFILLFTFLSAVSFSTAIAKTDFIIQEGFIYANTNVPPASPYKNGVLSLYYFIEQNFSVSPIARKFCRGTQRVLFEIEFDSLGQMGSVRPLERYNWYSIDVRARDAVTDLLEVIVSSKDWLNNYKGILYFPIRFFVEPTGRVRIDYFIFTRNTPRGARLGDI